MSEYAAQTPMNDHVEEFWRLLETEHVRILVDIRRQTEAMTYYDSSSFGNDVAKALVTDRATLLARAEKAEKPRVKALEWREWRGDWIGAAPYMLNYVICRRGEVFNLDLVGNFTSLTEAKAAAQADYEARILSALEPSS